MVYLQPVGLPQTSLLRSLSQHDRSPPSWTARSILPFYDFSARPLGALGVLLVNDLLFKALWPGAWIPGKLSDLAWMLFAPQVLAYVLSFATLESLRAQRAVFAAAYVGLPLLYAAFNTFEPVHGVVLRVLGLIGGDGPRSPLDPTDSLVIPLAMAAALWVWGRPPLDMASIRSRLALLAATGAGLASVASSYETDRGITDVGRTPTGTLGAHALSDLNYSGGTYESIDGGLTWTKASEEHLHLESQTQDQSGRYFTAGGWQISRLDATSGTQEFVYSYEYLRGGGNRWMLALDKREIIDRAIATTPYDLFYDDQSDNLIVAMGLQGVVVVAPDGTSARVAVGPYSPTDFSFRSKTRTFILSLRYPETLTVYAICVAILLAFSSAALTLPASTVPRSCFAFAAAISAFLAITFGVYPYELEEPWDRERGRRVIGSYALMFSGLGLLPFILVVAGLVVARPSRRQLLAIVAATVGMLALIALGALVLFEAGPGTANVVAVALVGLATLGLWAFLKRRQT